MDTNHYKMRPGENTDTLAARALGARSSKDLEAVFKPYVSVGRDQETLWAYEDSKNPGTIAAVATCEERGFNNQTTDRATVSTMTRKEWNAAYDRAYDNSGTAGNEVGDAHFVSALMKEVGGATPGRGNERWSEPSDDFQPRAPGRIKAAAAATQAKQAVPESVGKIAPKKARDGDER
jgi:hypothetical protein